MYTYSCTVLNVVDGDTLDVELDLGFNIKVKERVRLIGLDTPEIFGKNAVSEGVTASAFTKLWILERQKKSPAFFYQSKKYNARDKYGRSLGVLSWMNDGAFLEDLNSAIIASGNIKK